MNTSSRSPSLDHNPPFQRLLVYPPFQRELILNLHGKVADDSQELMQQLGLGQK